MKNVNNWEKFNELNAETYFSAADKLRYRHPKRAEKLTKYGHDVIKKEDVNSGELVTVLGKTYLSRIVVISNQENDIAFLGVNDDDDDFPIYSYDGRTSITDRKNARIFLDYLLSNKWSEQKDSKKLYHRAEEYLEEFKNMSINDFYSEQNQFEKNF
jgi:hypothetical protein